MGPIDRWRSAGGVEGPHAAKQVCIRKHLVGAIHVCRSGQSKILGLFGQGNVQAIPGPAPVVWVSLGPPARNSGSLRPCRIEFPGRRLQVDRFPPGVVEARLGPEGLAGLGINGGVADLELPRTIERNHRPAKDDGRGIRNWKWLG